MTKELRERFDKKFDGHRWKKTFTMGGIHDFKEDMYSFLESEILEAERLMKEQCAKKAFDFADNLEKKMGVDASYARAVGNLIQSLK